jgi:P27 family predicted phage terminase small subunit
MGTRGPQKKPIKELKLHGTFRDDRHSGPEIEGGEPGCPTWLDREGKAEWKRVVSVLVKRIGLAEIDRGLLALYCQAWSQFHRSETQLQKEGETIMVYVEDQDGELHCTGAKLHPLVKVRTDAADRMLKAAIKLGLSPAARTGLKIGEAKKPITAAEKFLS